MRYSVALLVLVGCLASAPAKPPESPAPQPAQPSAPVAKKEPRVLVLHGERRVDDYFWLRNKGAEDVVGYLKAENAYTDALMKPTEPFQEQLYQEMLARIQQTDVTVPYRQGQWLYYSRTERGKQYPINCRRQSTDAPEDVLLDLNEIAQGEKYLALDTSEVSDDGNLLAYDNLERKAYPTMLVLTSYNDSQVMYWEPAKYVAKLRAMKTDSNQRLFKINMDPAGHSGASGRYTRLRETAFDYAFILWQLGIKN